MSLSISFCSVLEKTKFSQTFLGARAPLEIARVKKNNNNRITKKFQIAINLLSFASTSTLILEIVRDTPKQSQIVPDNPRQSKIVPDSPKQSQIVPDSPRQSQRVLDSPRQSVMFEDSPRQSKIVPDSPRQSKIDPKSPRQSVRV